MFKIDNEEHFFPQWKSAVQVNKQFWMYHTALEWNDSKRLDGVYMDSIDFKAGRELLYMKLVWKRTFCYILFLIIKTQVSLSVRSAINTKQEIIVTIYFNPFLQQSSKIRGLFSLLLKGIQTICIRCWLKGWNSNIFCMGRLNSVILAPNWEVIDFTKS